MIQSIVWAGDILSQKETLELVRAYYRLGERPRRRLLDLAKALEGDGADRPSPDRSAPDLRRQRSPALRRPGPPGRRCAASGRGNAVVVLSGWAGQCSADVRHRARLALEKDPRLAFALKLADAARAAALPHFRVAATRTDNKASYRL